MFSAASEGGTVNLVTHNTGDEICCMQCEQVKARTANKILTMPTSDRPQMTMWAMCIACRIPKATNTPPYSVILIAFPR